MIQAATGLANCKQAVELPVSHFLRIRRQDSAEAGEYAIEGALRL
jgi:hypothetical protein